MSNPFFERPILNSPYERPGRHWELDADGQPTQQIIDVRRRSELIAPIPKAKAQEPELDLGHGAGISTDKQKYDPTPLLRSNGARTTSRA